MKTGKKDCDMTNRRKIVNDWARFDPDEPAEIPPQFSKGIYRSVYFPPSEAPQQSPAESSDSWMAMRATRRELPTAPWKRLLA